MKFQVLLVTVLAVICYGVVSVAGENDTTPANQTDKVSGNATVGATTLEAGNATAAPNATTGATTVSSGNTNATEASNATTAAPSNATTVNGTAPTQAPNTTATTTQQTTIPVTKSAFGRMVDTLILELNSDAVLKADERDLVTHVPIGSSVQQENNNTNSSSSGIKAALTLVGGTMSTGSAVGIAVGACVVVVVAAAVVAAVFVQKKKKRDSSAIDPQGKNSKKSYGGVGHRKVTPERPKSSAASSNLP